jgi:hypothetical protein
MGCTHSGDEAPLVKTKMQLKQKFQPAETGNNLSTIILTKMVPVATHHFPLPFQPPCHTYPDQPNQHLLPLSNRLTASPTLISPSAGPQRLAVFSSYHLRLGGPKNLCPQKTQITAT